MELKRASVVFRHHREAQGMHLFFRQTQADDSAAFTNEHSHLRFCQEFRSKKHIPFVLPVCFPEGSLKIPVMYADKYCDT